jgi:hypothetical protein
MLMALAALVVLGREPLAAQRLPPPIAPGARVRISAPKMFDRPVIGVLGELTPDTARVNVGDGTRVAIPAAAVEWVDRSNGTRRRAGAITGGVIGALLVGAAVIATDDTGGFGILVAPAAALLGGAPIGALVGAMLGSRERWTRFTYTGTPR